MNQPPDLEPSLKRMTQLLSGLAGGRQGFIGSSLPDVHFMRSAAHIPRSPIAYEPSIVIVAQGRKCGYLEDQVFTYDAANYLVLTIPLPFECETFGTPDEPLLAVSVSVSPTEVSKLLLEIDTGPTTAPVPARGVASSPLNAPLAEAAVRLLESLRASPEEARILGPQIVREITYRVLTGDQGHALRALANPQSTLGQVSRVLRRIHTDYAQALDVSSLAREAGMSVSTFHNHFKAVTSSPPLQYLKSVRLHKARMFMVHEGETASAAALRVGYESPSQFNREFKRYFGAPPARAAEEMRAILHQTEGVLAF